MFHASCMHEVLLYEEMWHMLCVYRTFDDRRYVHHVQVHERMLNVCIELTEYVEDLTYGVLTFYM
jgi:hypothetical protein